MQALIAPDTRMQASQGGFVGGDPRSFFNDVAHGIDFANSSPSTPHN